MKRRDFLRGSLLSALFLVSGSALAAEGGKKHYIRLMNRENPSLFEKKHVPGIEAPARVARGEWFDIKIRVGFLKEHPSVPEHWITSIKLLVDGKEVTSSTFPEGGFAAPQASFRIKLEKGSVIEAVEHCNLHGTWISDPFKINVA